MSSVLTIKEVQALSLKILLDVHDFCVRNNILYSLSGGTLIGAVREKGFLEWDDDVDIYMLRPDYERFIHTYKSENYRVLSMETDPDFCLPFSHVTDFTSTQVVQLYLPYYRKPSGVKIDIFPIDSVSDDESEFDDQFEKLMEIGKRAMYARKAMHKFSFKKPLNWNIDLLKRKLRTGNGKEAFETAHQIDALAKQHEFGSTGSLGLMCLPYRRVRQRFSKEDFSHCVDVTFENHQLHIMNGYHNVLVAAFGPDYMTPPPVEARAQHHIIYGHK